MNIKPLGEYVVIEPTSQEEKTKSGIFLPQNMDEKQPEQGKIIAIGPGKELKANAGENKTTKVMVGDTVLFGKYNVNEITFNSKKYLIIKQEDILAVLEN